MEISCPKPPWSCQIVRSIASLGFVACLLLEVAGAATKSGPALPSLAASVESADAAYKHLPGSLSAYNLAVREICAAMEMETTAQFVSSLKALGVRLTAPPIVAGTGRISKILMVGIWPAGANFVKARAEVKPAIPPPKIMISSPFVEAVEAIAP